MKSPEQQPTSEPEMDIEAAKKFLEEAYGPENSQIIVDKTIPIPEMPKIEPTPTDPPIGPEKNPKFYELPEEERRKRYEEMKQQEKEEQVVKPEQQPTSKQEMDIGGDKEHSNKIYGPENSQVIVDKTIPVQETPKTESMPPEPELKKDADEKISETKVIKNPEEVKNEKELGTEKNPIIAEVVEEKVEKKEGSTIEEITEKVRQEKAVQDTQIEAAKNDLIELARDMKRAREEKDVKTEYSVYDKAEKVFKTATGDSLEKVAREKAKVEAESEGLKIVTPEEYRKEKATKIRDGIRQETRSAVVSDRWDMLSDQEKGEYFVGKKYEDNLEAIRLAKDEFSKNFIKRVDDKIKELAEDKKGVSMSQDLFYELMKMGYKPEDAKKAGLPSRGMIKVPILPLSDADRRSPLLITKEFLAVMEAKVRKNIEDKTEKEMKEKILEGQRTWRKKKQRHTREMIRETAIKYETEKKPKEELKKPETKIEQPIEVEKEPNFFESVGYIDRLIKMAERNRKEAEKELEKLKKLKEIKKQGGIFNLKQKAILLEVDSAIKREVEK